MMVSIKRFRMKFSYWFGIINHIKYVIRNADYKHLIYLCITLGSWGTLESLKNLRMVEDIIWKN